MLYSRHDSGHSFFPGHPWDEKLLPHTILLLTVPLHHACPAVIHTDLWTRAQANLHSMFLYHSQPTTLQSRVWAALPQRLFLIKSRHCLPGTLLYPFKPFVFLAAVIDSPLFLPLPTPSHGSESWPFWNLSDVSDFAYVSQISTINLLLYHT